MVEKDFMVGSRALRTQSANLNPIMSSMLARHQQTTVAYRLLGVGNARAGRTQARRCRHCPSSVRVSELHAALLGSVSTMLVCASSHLIRLRNSSIRNRFGTLPFHLCETEAGHGLGQASFLCG